MRFSVVTSATALSVAIFFSTIIAQDQEGIPAAASAQSRPIQQAVFIENLGQWPDSILFRSEIGEQIIWFTSTGWYYQLLQTDTSEAGSQGTQSVGSLPVMSIASEPFSPSLDNGAPRFASRVIGAKMLGGQGSDMPTGEQPYGYKCSYFLGSDSTKWAHGASAYQAIRYPDAYDRIDARFYARGDEMEFDFIVKPGGDLSDIRLGFSGVSSVDTAESGDLILVYSEDTVIHRKPMAYQLVQGSRKAVSCRYDLLDGTSAGFRIQGEYDQSQSLTIDPVLVYSTFLGGSRQDVAYNVCVDHDGYAYITGLRTSVDFPASSRFVPYYTTQPDVFVTKLSPQGAIVYSTLVGGDLKDVGTGIAVDAEGCAYVTGTTFSYDFPLVNPFQDNSNYYAGDAFVFKLSADGSELVYSTYFGGTEKDEGGEVLVASDGGVILSGSTYSPDFPVRGGVDTTHDGYSDMYVCKLSAAGDSLIFGTFVGGNSIDGSYHLARVCGLAMDSSGFLCLAGFTMSTNFPAVNAIDSTENGRMDGTVTRLSPNCDSIVFSTYLGGSEFDESFDVAVGEDQGVYVCGQTTSMDFPWLNAYSRGNVGIVQGYVTKFSPEGRLIYATGYGGGFFDQGQTAFGIAVCGSGVAYACGESSSLDLPLKDPLFYWAGWNDMFVVGFSPVGNELAFGTYLGGSDWDDAAYALAMGPDGSLYVVGTLGKYEESFYYSAAAYRIADLPTSVEEPQASTLPSEYNLGQNYPNPFNPLTHIRFSLPRAGELSLVVFNILGEKVRHLASGRFASGDHSVMWDGRDDSGHEVASGIYLYCLMTDSGPISKKMVLVR